MENEKIEKDLEKQFTESLNSKLTQPGHIGLGFSGPTFNRPTSNTHKKFDDDDIVPQKPAETNTTSAASSALADARAKYKKMNFVKPSS